jgi:hypothetical protein
MLQHPAKVLDVAKTELVPQLTVSTAQVRTSRGAELQMKSEREGHTGSSWVHVNALVKGRALAVCRRVLRQGNASEAWQ